VPYSSSLSNQKWKLIIEILTKFSEWPPLFAIVYLGDPVLLENLLSKSKDYPKKQVDQTKEKSVPSR
jgi:hypothetical protein